jgi:hypothetical protein
MKYEIIKKHKIFGVPPNNLYVCRENELIFKSFRYENFLEKDSFIIDPAVRRHSWS